MKKISLIILFVTTIAFGQAEVNEISSMPGAFSRMGFGARGMGMGNAMAAVTDGNMIPYYNPALGVFQEDNYFQTSYSFLSLDRSLNFLNFTKRFNVGKKRERDDFQRYAGISVGLINAGVSGIEERTSEGYKTGDLSTSENVFFLSLSNKFSEKLALGITVKYFYYSLYEDISSTGLGVDIGALYKFSNKIMLSFMISDINSKYKWDTNDLFGQDGNTSTDKFPLLKKIGLAYKVNENVLTSFEFESSNAGTSILRGGIEYCIQEGLYLRGGIDKFNISNSDFPARPSLGFSYLYTLNSWKVGIDYAFVIEPYSTHDQHIIGLNIRF
ncbi:MAG: hypothetical protein JEY94_00805 [Melioribacteraceae bacterium]|nr:hypothetical protein [Melioribacteraceae bacterium]